MSDTADRAPSDRAPAPEFSHMIDRRQLKEKPVRLVADAQQREDLARRFGIPAIHSLTAELQLTPDGEAVVAAGRLEADIVQSCAISGDDLQTAIAEDISLRFVPEQPIEAEEIELEEEDLDEIPFAGNSFDLGEAVAQSLALAIDPYLTGPDADQVRTEVGLSAPQPDGPLQQALAKLKKD